MSKRSSDDFTDGPPGKLATPASKFVPGGETEEKRTSSLTSADGTKKPKLAFSIGRKPLNQNKVSSSVNSTKVVRKIAEPIKNDSLKAAFNSESEEEEEMPPEAKMRMRNIGRDTPTSAGPNSFGKTKQGFCDAKKVFEKRLKDAAEKSREEDN